MNNKLRTKLLALFIAFIIAVFLSIVLAWVIVQIFTKQPEKILEFSVGKTFSIFALKEGIQIFFLCLLCFALLIAVSVFKIFNLDDYLSKTYPVTKEIRIPVPVGKEQTQQGSSWWLAKKDFPKIFGVNTFDNADPTINHLLTVADEERKREANVMDKMEEYEKNFKEKYKAENGFDFEGEIDFPEDVIPKEPKLEKTVEPIYKSGGLVIGKKDRNIYTPHIKKFKGIFPYLSLSKRKVEDIYYIKDDMHSLTVGATRSGKTRCLVLQSIDNIGLARRKYDSIRS